MANLFNSNPLMGLGLALSTFGGQESMGTAMNLLNYARQNELIDEERRKEQVKNAAAGTLLRTMDASGTPQYKQRTFTPNPEDAVAGVEPITFGRNAPAENLLSSSMETGLLSKAVGPTNLLSMKLAAAQKGSEPIKLGKDEAVYDKAGNLLFSNRGAVELPNDVREAMFAAGGDEVKARALLAQKYAKTGGDEMTAWQKSQVENQNRRFDQQDRAMAEAAARAAAAEEARNRPQATGYMNRATGNPVRYKPDIGSYIDEDGGKTVSGSDLVPAADFNKDVEAARAIVGDIANADSVTALVKANKGAFETKKVNEARIKKNVPFYGEQMASDVFTPEERTIRARVAQDSAVILNKLYGAALSAGENTRAMSFAPNPDDTLEQLLPKLDAAKVWANSKKTALLPSAIKAAERQLSAPKAAAAYVWSLESGLLPK